MPNAIPPRPALDIGHTYTMDQLGDLFQVSPHYLRSAGGIVSVPALSSTLVFTDQSGDASFNYGDYWEGSTLIYAGRGQTGDQKLEGQNRDVADNLRELWLFEHTGPSQRTFLGNPICRRVWPTSAEDKKGNVRRVFRFALELKSAGTRPTPPPSVAVARRAPLRTPRPFDELKPPKPPKVGERSATPEQTAQQQEKASAGHHKILVTLKRQLDALGWTDIEEIPCAVDLWARRGTTRVLFEAKTISPGQEPSQMRSALAQLLEYRYEHGNADDCLCVVTDMPVADSRLRFLSSLGIGVLFTEGDKITPCGLRGAELLGTSA